MREDVVQSTPIKAAGNGWAGRVYPDGENDRGNDPKYKNRGNKGKAQRW